jgi:hypothetical protein
MPKKHTIEIKERAYDLMMLQGMTLEETVRTLRANGVRIAAATLHRWRNDTAMGWEGRYRTHCEEIARRSDRERVKQFKPIVSTIQDVRDRVYNKLITALDATTNVITDKNFAHVLSSFVKLAELEHQTTGGGGSGAPVQQVITVILAVLERNPNVGPVITRHKGEIVDAVFEELGK